MGMSGVGGQGGGWMGRLLRVGGVEGRVESGRGKVRW